MTEPKRLSRFAAFSLSVVAFALPACSHTVGSSVPGIENFQQVDSHVYRGGQPSEEGFQYLAGLGVKTVIDLREADKATGEKAMVEHDGMRFISVPMTGMTPPTGAEMDQILAVLEDANSGPVFVHCQRGADRTGAVIAAYHIDHDKWDNTHALQDAKAHAMSPFQFQRQAFIRNFQPRPVVRTAAPAPEAQPNSN